VGLGRFVASAFPNHQVVVPHLPGYVGSSHVPLEPSDPLGLAAVEVVAREATIVVGMSAGAYRALALATRGNLPLGRIVCLGPLARIEPAIQEALTGAAAALRAGVDLSEAVVGTWFSPRFAMAEPARALEVVRTQISSISPQALADELDAIVAAPDLVPELPGVSADVHLIVASADQATPPEQGELILRALPSASQVVLEGVGHLSHIESPERVIAELQRMV